MATRKSKSIERELVHQATSRVPIESAPQPRGRKRHNVAAEATAGARPALHLVTSSKAASAAKSARGTISTAVSGLASAMAAPATQLPLCFPQPLGVLSAALTTSIEHTAPAHPTRTSHSTATQPTKSQMAHRPSVRARFGELREALAEGFEIVQPIFARPLWSVSDDSTTAFNFVLRRERTTRLVTVPEGRTVQRFIRERQLLVDYRR